MCDDYESERERERAQERERKIILSINMITIRGETHSKTLYDRTM